MKYVAFTFHLIVTLGAWFIPFLFSWPYVLFVLGAVMLQFAIFGKCLVNEHHNLEEIDHETFYSDIMERLGMQPNRKRVKFLVRRVLYPTLSVVAIVWQVVLGNAPLWF